MKKLLCVVAFFFSFTSCSYAEALLGEVISQPEGSTLTFTLLDELSADDGSVVTKQVCVAIEGGTQVMEVLPRENDVVRTIPVFTETTRYQLLGLMLQLDNLVNAQDNTSKALNNMADLYSRREEVNIELDELEKLVKIMFDDG